MGEGTVVVTLSDVLVALKALREEVQMLRKLVQPVVGGPVLGRTDKDVEPTRESDDELRRKIDDLLSRPPAPPPNPFYPPPSYPSNPFYPPLGHPYPYWAPTWACGELKADNRPMWNASSP